MLTQAELKLIFEYDPETGLWKRKPPVHFNAYSDWWEGTVGTRGYRLLKIKGKYEKAHRLAFLYMTGEWPKNIVDHLDRNTSNNKWNNLRDVSQTENQYNAKDRREPGLRGVIYRNGKYSSYIGHKQKHIFLGNFDSCQEAHQAYLNKRLEYDNQSN